MLKLTNSIFKKSMGSRRRLKTAFSNESSTSMIDLTAMTDIIFILLIFFILTSNVAQNIFDFEIPKADENFKEAKQPNSKEVKVSLFANGEFAIGETIFKDYKAFTNALKIVHKKDVNAEFLLVTEKTLPVQNLMQVLTFFKSENITKIDVLIQSQ